MVGRLGDISPLIILSSAVTKHMILLVCISEMMLQLIYSMRPERIFFMLSTTRRALSAILDTDISITPEQKKIILAVADRPLIQRELPQAIPRVIRREEAAKCLGVSVKRVDQLSTMGILKRIIVPGTTRALGISEASLRSLTDPESKALASLD